MPPPPKNLMPASSPLEFQTLDGLNQGQNYTKIGTFGYFVLQLHTKILLILLKWKKVTQNRVNGDMDVWNQSAQPSLPTSPTIRHSILTNMCSDMAIDDLSNKFTCHRYYANSYYHQNPLFWYCVGSCPNGPAIITMHLNDLRAITDWVFTIRAMSQHKCIVVVVPADR